jgi:hypothetical protein
MIIHVHKWDVLENMFFKKQVIPFLTLLAIMTVSAIIPLGFSQTPYIDCVPSIGYVGDMFALRGYEFDAHVGDYVTIYFENDGFFGYKELWNDTISSSDWEAVVAVPDSWGGNREVHVRFSNGTTLIASDTFTVLPTLEVTPDTFYNDPMATVRVIGRGFYYDQDYVDGYMVYVDNSLYMGANENWSLGINSTGYILTEFVASGFRPGLHEVHVIPYSAGVLPSVIMAMDTFTVLTDGDPIVEYLDDINGTVVSISDGMATLETEMGETTVSLAQLDAKIVALQGSVATISTKIGSIETSISAIGGTVNTINGNVATIKTDVGTLEGKITDIEDCMATVETDVGTVKVDISDAKTQLSEMVTNDVESPSVDMLPVWVAVIFAVIAAVGSIVGVIVIRKK